MFMGIETLQMKGGGAERLYITSKVTQLESGLMLEKQLSPGPWCSSGFGVPEALSWVLGHQFL